MCQVVEDEEHFVTNCSINKAERRLLYSKISCRVPRISRLSDFDKFVYLLTNNDPHILTWFGKFVHQSYIARNNIFLPQMTVTGISTVWRCPHLGRLVDRFKAFILFCVLCNTVIFYWHFFYTNVCKLFYILYTIYFIYCIYLWFYVYVLCQKWRNKDVQSIYAIYGSEWYQVIYPLFMILRIRVLHFTTVTESEIWQFNHYLELGHEQWCAPCVYLYSHGFNIENAATVAPLQKPLINNECVHGVIFCTEIYMDN